MVKQATGANTQYKIAFETEYGNDPINLASKAVRLPFNTSELVASQNMVDPQTITGRRDSVEPIRGNVNTSGTTVFPVDATAFGYILKMCFGDPLTTELADNKYKHVYKPSTEQPSMVIEKAFPDIDVYEKFNGVKISKLSINFGGDGELTASVDMMGAKATISDMSISDTALEAKFDRLENMMATLKIGDQEVAIAKNISLEIDFGLDGDGYTIGNQGYRGRVNAGIINISGTASMFFESDTYLQMSKSNITTSLEILLNDNDNFSLSFLMPEIKFTPTSPSIDSPAGLNQNLNYKAFYKSNSENTSILTTLINNTEIY